MIVNHRHKFIFMKTKKTGGTSIELALRSLCGEDDIISRVTEDASGLKGRGPQNYLYPKSEWPLLRLIRWQLGWRPSAKVSDLRGIGYFGHATAQEIKSRLGENVWSSYFKFTVERNPWDRTVSHYYFKTRNKKNPPTFADFVHSGRHLDNWSIYAIGGAIAVDHVIRYGDLQTGLAGALAKIGLEAPPLTRAKGDFRPRAASYREMYDDHARETIRRRYQREIDEFGWTF